MSSPRRVCPTCKTTKFRKSTDSGLVCKYGHKLLGIQQEQAEDDGPGAARGLRRKAVPKIHHYENESNPVQQKSDFLLIIQYTLQVLSRCMVQELNFPPELEPTIRELWLLYISDAKVEIAEAYMYEAHEKEVMDKMKRSQGQKKDILEKLELEELALDAMSDSSASYSSSDDDEMTDTKQKKRRIQQVGSSRIKWPRLTFSNTLVFIYLACIYLNYPILPNDLVRWCRTGQIPYLNMQERIPESKLGSLTMFLSKSMTHVPSTDQVAKDAHNFSRCFSNNCKLDFPNLNIPLYLDRFCAQFFLPVEGYYYAEMIFTTYRQRHFLDLSIVQRNYRKTPATTILMACVMAAVKLIYGIGDHESYTMSCVSEFDIATTKETWMDRIHENISRWKKMYEDQDDLDKIIRLIKDTSVASRIAAPPREKQNVIINTLNQSVGFNNNNIMVNITSQTDTFMDNYDLVKKESSGDTLMNYERIDQGKFYYGRKYGLAPKHYLDMIELATLVTGQTTNSTIEVALQDIDKHLTVTNPARTIKKARYNTKYSLKTSLPTSDD